jgi:hypothetical protein
MKIIKNTIVTLILFTVVSFAQQQPPEDLQKVKDALVNSTIQIQELQKQNNNLTQTLQRVADDLKKIKTVVQLDSLKKVYGIVEESKDEKKKK